MPGPALYIVVGVVGAVAAGIAFKEFVYDPHLAPKIDEWAEAVKAYRNERRRQRTAAHSAMAGGSSDDGNSSDDSRTGVELESMVQREMEHLGDGASLRRRNVPRGSSREPSILENSNPSIPYAPLSPRSLSSLGSAPMNPFSDPSETSLPSRKLSLGSERAPSPPQPHIQPDNTLSRAAGNPNNIAILPPSPTSPAPRSLTPNFVVEDQNYSSHGSEIFDSRSSTPFTDAISNHSFADVRSGISFSDVAHSEFSFAADESDFEEQLPTSSFVLPSHPSASTSSFHTSSDDFAGVRQSQAAPPSTSGRLTDEEWDHVSQA